MTPLMVVCLLVAVVSGHPWGHPQQVHDTPEVAAAKASHLATHAKAHQEAQEHLWNAQDRSWTEDDGSYKEENNGNRKDDNGSWKTDEGSWGPQTHAWTAQPQKWNSPQVHYSTPQQSHWEVPQKKWTGPIALPPGYDKHGAPLPVQDTPEVAAEKSKHLHLFAHGAHAASAATHTASSWKTDSY